MTPITSESETAYQALGGDPKDFREAYAGSYDNDQAFAKKVATDMNELPDENHWPQCHIDWAQAARELMQDYQKQDGYYFKK